MENKKMDKQEQIKTLVKNLEDGTKKIFEKGIYEEDNFKKYLDVVSKFYNYFSRNIILISSQRANATYVAGFNKWKSDFSRSVNKGEKGIQILMPIVWS